MTTNESLLVWTVIPGVSPEEVYAAWLDGERHAAMTGGAATSADAVGKQFTAWDGYIAGETLELERGARILQSWRTTEFPAEAPDSLLEILFEETPEGTHVTVVHTRIPAGQGEGYAGGWSDHYFEPMKKHFKGRAKKKSAMKTTAAGRPAAKLKAKKKKVVKKAAKKKVAAAPRKKKTKPKKKQGRTKR